MGKSGSVSFMNEGHTTLQRLCNLGNTAIRNVEDLELKKKCLSFASARGMSDRFVADIADSESFSRVKLCKNPSDNYL